MSDGVFAVLVISSATLLLVVLSMFIGIWHLGDVDKALSQRLDRIENRQWRDGDA